MVASARWALFGFTDGLSMFKAGRFYANPFGPGLRAGLLHDADYFFQDKTRKEADALFYQRLPCWDTDGAKPI